jgi:DNA polymerase III subunit epsilon
MSRFAKANAIKDAQYHLSMNPIFLDTETTGLSNQDVVIEVGVVDLAGQILFQSLVNPPIPIPAAATAIHGITADMLSEAPTWKAAWDELHAVLQGRHVGIYNKEFDLRMMKQTNNHKDYLIEWNLDDNRVFCVMELYARFYGQRSKLESAGAACGISLPNSHRAVDDAKLTAALFNYIANYPS